MCKYCMCNNCQADRKSGEKKTNQATKAIVDTMTAKKRELMSKTRVASDDEESDVASDNDDAAMLNGDEKEMPINIDVLLSEEKNPWMETGIQQVSDIRTSPYLRHSKVKSSTVNV